MTDQAAEERPAWLPSLDDRSLDSGVCPFLRAARDGGLTAPFDSPDPGNRCAALREVMPQSLRQQELVCLTSGHTTCPRYLRGAAVVADAPAPIVRAGPSLPPAIFGSLLVLILAFSVAVAFVVSRGGLELTAGAPPTQGAPSIAAASPGSEPSDAPSNPPTNPPSTTPTATPTATPTVSLAPPPTATPTVNPTPSPTPAPTPRPTSDRYSLLTACPDAADCWIYRVRVGDNLTSIANYFGVSLDSVYHRNPWVRTTGLRQGQELRLPPPTR